VKVLMRTSSLARGSLRRWSQLPTTLRQGYYYFNLLTAATGHKPWLCLRPLQLHRFSVLASLSLRPNY